MKRVFGRLVGVLIFVVLIFATGCTQTATLVSADRAAPQSPVPTNVPDCCWLESPEAHHARYVDSSSVDDRYSFTLKTEPPIPAAGEKVILSVEIREKANAAGDVLGLHPERRVHLTVISDNLEDFAHVHVTETEGWKQPALTQGRYSMQFMPLVGGPYRLRVDFLEGDEVIAKTLAFQVEGPEQSGYLCRLDREARAGGVTARVYLTPESPMAGREILMRTNFSIDEQPVTDLESYAGALVHVSLVGPMKEPRMLHIHGGGQEYTTFTTARYIADYSGPKTYWATLVGGAGCYRVFTQIERPDGRIFFKHDFKVVEYSDEP